VDPGERGQVTQFREGITDDSRWPISSWNSASAMRLTSVTTYIDRQVEVLRDASQLTGSVTIDLGGTAADARLNHAARPHRSAGIQPGVAFCSSGEGRSSGSGARSTRRWTENTDRPCHADTTR